MEIRKTWSVCDNDNVFIYFLIPTHADTSMVDTVQKHLMLKNIL